MVDDRELGILPFSKNDFKKHKQAHFKEIRFSPDDKDFLTRYLIYIDKTERFDPKPENPVAREVRRFAEKLNQKLQNYEEGKLDPCGSYFENTKVGEPDEFDYIYLIERKAFPVLAEVPKTKPSKSPIETKSFYRLYNNKEDTTKANEIIAAEKQLKFLDAIKEAISKMFPGVDPDFALCLAGPAVKILMRLEDGSGNSSVKPIKIDVSLAIKPSEDFLEPHDFQPDVTDRNELSPHFVAANDFWKISFSTSEKDIMKDHVKNPYKAACYRSLKILRSRVEVKDTLGEGVLPTYPIKVTFMRKLRGADVDWTENKVGENVINMAQSLEEKGESHELTGIFLKQDRVFGESDRSYLEGRRIRKKLQEATKHNYYHAVVQSIIWLVIIASSTAILIAAIVTRLTKNWKAIIAQCLKQHLLGSPNFPLTLLFLASYTGLAWILLTASLTGLLTVWALYYRFQQKTFRVMPNLMIIYPITMIASLFHVSFNVVMWDGYMANDTCKYLGDERYINTAAISIPLFAVVPLILLLVSIVSTCAMSGEEQGGKCRFRSFMLFEFPCIRQPWQKLSQEEREAYAADSGEH